MNQIIQQIRDVLDTLLPVQEITIKLNETQMQLLPAERQELARFVDEAVSSLLAIDCLLTDRKQEKECQISADVAGRAENSFCMNCGCEVYCENCDPNPSSQ